MLSDFNLLLKFLGEVICAANHLEKRLQTKISGKTPYQLWTNRQTKLHYLRVFYCKTYAYINRHKRQKLDHKAVQGILVGYDNYSKGYLTYTSGKNIRIARTVKFLKNKSRNINETVQKQLNFYENTNGESLNSQNKIF